MISADRARFACGGSGTPPYAVATRSLCARLEGRQFVGTWDASSRVDTSTRPAGRRLAPAIRAMSGRPNASVFPEPVGDSATTSTPASASAGRAPGSRTDGECARGECAHERRSHAERLEGLRHGVLLL